MIYLTPGKEKVKTSFPQERFPHSLPLPISQAPAFTSVFSYMFNYKADNISYFAS